MLHLTVCFLILLIFCYTVFRSNICCNFYIKLFLDCLDFGNNKKAVSEAEKVIKKHDLMAAKVNNFIYSIYKLTI